MPRALKVYRTPIGFHDAYVAAPSQKAALAAWGTDRNLFARGEAELVEDAALTAEPLAHPGTVIRRSRGTTAEQIAALGAAPKRRAAAKTKRAAPPRPSRDALDAAERALADVGRQFEDAHVALRARERALADERRALERREAAAMKAAEQARDKADAAYRAALQAWRG